MPNSTVYWRPWTIGRWVWLTYGDLTHQWLPSTQTWTPRSVLCRPPNLPLHNSRLQVWQLTYLDHESMVHVLGLQLWGEIRIPQVLGSNTKTSSLSYLARGAHRQPLTPLKDAQSKFKYTEAKPRCTCLPPSQYCRRVGGKGTECNFSAMLTSHSLIISREVLILTLSIFNALKVCISWYSLAKGLMSEAMIYKDHVIHYSPCALGSVQRNTSLGTVFPRTLPRESIGNTPSRRNIDNAPAMM